MTAQHSHSEVFCSAKVDPAGLRMFADQLARFEAGTRFASRKIPVTSLPAVLTGRYDIPRDAVAGIVASLSDHATSARNVLVNGIPKLEFDEVTVGPSVR